MTSIEIIGNNEEESILLPNNMKLKISYHDDNTLDTSRLLSSMRTLTLYDVKGNEIGSRIEENPHYLGEESINEAYSKISNELSDEFE